MTTLNTMLVDDLSKYDIPTGSKTAATNFLRANPVKARDFASVFGFTDSDERVTLRAAQLAAVAVYEESPDVAAAISAKIDGYRSYITKQDSLTGNAPEAAAPEAAAPEAAAPEAAAPEAAAPEATGEVKLETDIVPKAEPKVKSGRGKGRPTHASQGKLTGQQRAQKWLDDNNIASDCDRSEAALKLSSETGMKMSSCLVYLSIAFKK